MKKNLDCRSLILIIRNVSGNKFRLCNYTTAIQSILIQRPCRLPYQTTYRFIKFHQLLSWLKCNTPHIEYFVDLSISRDIPTIVNIFEIKENFSTNSCCHGYLK